MAARDEVDVTRSEQPGGRRSLPLVNGGPKGEALDIDAELAAFEQQERARLGLGQERAQWRDEMVDPSFTKSQRATTTLLVCGLTMAHDLFVEAGLKGLGYNVKHIDAPDNAALQYGKEFGNRGQCNPTYYTVGNLVKYLSDLRDKGGLTTQEVIDRYVFVTAGACGPCRFGMYVTEYRKALRDAGFDGFRVLLFQQTGGFKQATGEGVGLEMNPAFFVTLTKAILMGDVVNAVAYRIRPYEVEPGATDRAMEAAKKIIYAALAARSNTLVAMHRARREFAAVQVDRLRPKPKASIIGEFWAMTTEGDGNYQLQRFLESEGAEVDIQLVTAWLLYMLWEGRRDTKERQNLRGADGSLYGLDGLGTYGIAKRLATLRFAEAAARTVFGAYAVAGGLYNYHLPDMDEVAAVAHEFYSNDLRGGEGHMEVGKLILNSLKRKAHVTVSVKPFGCMPSASVSDGVQSLITERFPGSIFCAVETSGDGRVNFYSRIQMYLFKARAAAEAEFDAALAQYGLTKEQVEAYLAKHPRLASPLFKPDHVDAGSAADLVHHVAPYLTKSFAERQLDRARGLAKAVREGGPKLVAGAKGLYERAPEIAERLKADAELVRDLARGKFDEMLPLASELLARSARQAESTVGPSAPRAARAEGAPASAVAAAE
ncbi:MAG TPA: 2-hydroxyglutaryl-CoA dehydratase [Polyangiaceae bacterium]|nr:2-hydroxyglutaryl-CoA dehydratase [Polyangiaceae bacterium]